MNRVDKKFRELKRTRSKAFIAYITAGDPSLAKTEQLVVSLEKAGSDIIELGIPFSDPLADGPTIQRASLRSLKQRTTVTKIIKLVKSIRIHSNIPILVMTYYNPVYRYGVGRFIKDTREAGVDGVIVPDLPPEEAGELIKLSKKIDYSCIFLLAPTSTRKRVKLVARASNPFIYYVSLTGVTGERKKLPKEISKDVKKIKRVARMPVCVGFGISNESQAKAISKVADGVIVGSAIVKVVERNLGKPDLVKKVSSFVSKLVKAVKR